MLLGVDVGGTFTDAVLFDGSRLFTAKAPTTPDDQSEGVLAAVEAALERAGAAPGDVEALRPRDDRRHQRPARGARRAHGADRDRGLRRPARDRPPEPPRLYRLCAPQPAPLVAPDDRIEAAERVGPERRGRGARAGRARADRRARRAEPAPSRSRSACCSPTSSPAHERAIAERLRDALPRRPRLRLARGAAAVSRVRALLDHGHRRLPLPAAGPLPRPARRGRGRARAARARR